VYCSENAKIIVQPGGKLIIDGGVLTSACNSNAMWQGVTVQGNPALWQLPQTKQGWLIMKNNATVENAVCGVTIAAGGIIETTDALFFNNSVGVEFEPYAFFENGYERPNRSSFTTTAFKTDVSQYDQDRELIGAKLNSVNGVRFSGCQFINVQITPDPDPSEYADIIVQLKGKFIYNAKNFIGIKAENAGFTVDALCSNSMIINNICTGTETRSLFQGLRYGIHATNSNASHAIKVKSADFSNNLTGIEMSSISNFSVFFSHFSLKYPDYDLVGLSSNHSTGFRIEENTFDGEPDNGSVGLRINNSDANNNQIYKNTFDNLYIGQHFKGKNHHISNSYIGLQTVCNEHANILSADIFVGPASPNGGICSYQCGEIILSADPLKSAGNKFSDLPGLRFDNHGIHVNYYYATPREEPTNSYGITAVPALQENKCPSKLTGYFPDVLEPLLFLEGKYQSNLEGFNAVLYNYHQLMDGGNTQALLDAIQGEWSNDVWLLREKLLKKSPFVSREVLEKTALENLLPQALYLEICLANPDATRDKDFIYFLEYKIPNPLPSYMLNLIMASWNTKTLRTEMELTLSSLGGEKDYCLNQLIHFDLTDSIIDHTAVHALFLERGSFDDYFAVAQSYIESNRFQDATNLLYDLSQLLDVKREADLLDEIDFFNGYIHFREDIFNQGKDLFHLTKDDLLFLMHYAVDYAGKPRVAACNILCSIYGICMNEKEPKEKSLSKPNTASRAPEPAYGTMETLPNPAKTYTTFKWDFGSLESKIVLTIYDPSGKLITTQELATPQGQWVWNTTNIPGGVYTYSATSKSLQVASGKVMVAK
jgi:hypothetical protein